MPATSRRASSRRRDFAPQESPFGPRRGYDDPAPRVRHRARGYDPAAGSTPAGYGTQRGYDTRRPWVRHARAAIPRRSATSNGYADRRVPADAVRTAVPTLGERPAASGRGRRDRPGAAAAQPDGPAGPGAGHRHRGRGADVPAAHDAAVAGAAAAARGGVLPGRADPHVPAAGVLHPVRARWSRPCSVGDRVLVNKIVYDVRPPERGEVVVFRGTDNWAPENFGGAGRQPGRAHRPHLGRPGRREPAGREGLHQAGHRPARRPGVVLRPAGSGLRQRHGHRRAVHLQQLAAGRAARSAGVRVATVRRGAGAAGPAVRDGRQPASCRRTPGARARCRSRTSSAGPSSSSGPAVGGTR